MTANRKRQLLLFMAGMIVIPTGLLAQGNHCAAQKSPKKMAVDSVDIREREVGVSE